MLIKIFSIISTIYKIINMFLKIKKGQANFADIPLDYIAIEAYTEPDNLEEIMIRNVSKINFNENLKTATFINSLGTFTFNVDKIKSITLFDSLVYKDANKI